MLHGTSPFERLSPASHRHTLISHLFPFLSLFFFFFLFVLYKTKASYTPSLMRFTQKLLPFPKKITLLKSSLPISSRPLSGRVLHLSDTISFCFMFFLTATSPRLCFLLLYIYSLLYPISPMSISFLCHWGFLTSCLSRDTGTYTISY
ncbi:hypothetical protein BJ508DRAFT_138548 [Ascobolus immersus RN42]|uniref:Uncharacterized protein n=1 Tax=Ascobolus immersus RN42 TaxID=1160509 RepID=A0A3N4I2K2_ASCIM|nr:hypothetical protein BJ508DRAFT_138548 [Ascobolus immersus RN42]